MARVDLAHLARDFAVAVEIGRHIDRLRTERCARTADMAECTPKRRASYEAAQTTERGPVQATTTGRPRSAGLSRCSTEA